MIVTNVFAKKVIKNGIQTNKFVTYLNHRAKMEKRLFFKNKEGGYEIKQGEMKAYCIDNISMSEKT